MSRISIARRSELTTQRPSTVEQGIEKLIYFEGSATEPELIEVFLPPNYVAEPHTHGKAEIITILEGDIRVGARTLSRGDSVAVPADTMYGFTAGAEGVRFLNFRASAGAGYQTKDEFMRSRSSR